jgi:hypothetical protein
MLPTPFQYFQLVFLEHLEKENNFGYSMAFVNMNLCVYFFFFFDKSLCLLTIPFPLQPHFFPISLPFGFPFLQPLPLFQPSIIKNTQLL